MKIMFICSGNICRSVMAHWLLAKKIKDSKRNDIEVYSCGIYAMNGDLPTYEAKKIMKDEYGIDISSHRATNIYNSNIEEMDLILCATKSHKIAVINRYADLSEKVHTMKDYIGYERQYHDRRNIKDPWGYDMEEYRSCVAEIEECIDGILLKL